MTDSNFYLGRAYDPIKQTFTAQQTTYNPADLTTHAVVTGMTGSGKTEIYLRAVQHTLEAGRQAIILVPEIALTPQTIRRFADRFPGQAGMLHSGLSEGERYDTWRRARQGLLGMVVGPRSALFTPFPNLGLIMTARSRRSARCTC